MGKASRADLRIYTEIGIGNAHFVSTEIEKGNREHRVQGFVRMQVKDIYLRIWIGYSVFVLSTKDGFTTKRKTKRKFKALFGIGGIAREKQL